ncbi:hypothetical protein AVEN_154467-1 [Araneus ventricosus]|uniref:Uncharacterized protein n=1 Tax=Araneus ventricosus TaxID=182803 RepID=A0A4Y2TTQ7_ARAVE|nr:hypothetical protein AVEN_154467-1 [Araneus ventricosus]
MLELGHAHRKFYLDSSCTVNSGTVTCEKPFACGLKTLHCWMYMIVKNVHAVFTIEQRGPNAKSESTSHPPKPPHAKSGHVTLRNFAC